MEFVLSNVGTEVLGYNVPSSPSLHGPGGMVILNINQIHILCQSQLCTKQLIYITAQSKLRESTEISADRYTHLECHSSDH